MYSLDLDNTRDCTVVTVIDMFKNETVTYYAWAAVAVSFELVALSDVTTESDQSPFPAPALLPGIGALPRFQGCASRGPAARLDP